MKMLNTSSADIPTTGKTSKLTQAKRRSLAICALLVAMTSACDSKADLTFDQTTFTQVKTSGLTLAAGECKSPVSKGMMSRFLLMGSQGAALTKDDVIAMLGREFKEEDLSYSNSSVAGYLPGGVSCDSNTCHVSDSYPKLSCESSLDNAVGGGCGINKDLQVSDSPSFVSKDDNDQIFIVLVEDGASVRGMVPAPYNNSSYRVGTPTGPQTIQKEDSRTTDPGGGRSALVALMVENLKKVARAAKETQGKETELGLYAFSNETVGQAGYFPKKGKSFVGLSSFGSALADLASRLGDNGSLPETRGGSNVVKALEAVLKGTEGHPSIEQNANGKEVVLFLFVDGPDDYRTNPSSVITALKGKKVRTFIVHVDPPLPSGTNVEDVYPDLPSYYQDQANNCTNDSDCYTYEKCAEPTKWYKGGVLEYPNKTGKFCVPNRGADGRIGPIDEYSELACATGGGYIYLPNRLDKINNDSKASPAWIPWALDALWEVPVNFAESQQIMTPGRYQFGTKFEVKLDLRKRSVDLEKRGENGPDTRAAVVVPRQKNP